MLKSAPSPACSSAPARRRSHGRAPSPSCAARPRPGRGSGGCPAGSGVGSPLGWLWTMISAVAPSAMARAITSRTWTEASSTRALPQRLVGDQHVLGVEEQDAHLLDPLVRHCRVEIIAERVPARQDRLALDPRFEQPQRGRFGDLERGDGRIGQPLAAQACRRWRRAAARSRRNRASSRLASGLVSTRGMVSVSRYSTSS